jgi:hypothetical protein
MIGMTKVGMADLKVVKHPGSLTTLGLGSCIGICLYDPSSKTIGMAHIMLPSSKTIKNNSNTAKFADTAIIERTLKYHYSGRYFAHSIRWERPARQTAVPLSGAKTSRLWGCGQNVNTMEF